MFLILRANEVPVQAMREGGPEVNLLSNRKSSVSDTLVNFKSFLNTSWNTRQADGSAVVQALYQAAVVKRTLSVYKPV